MAVALNELPFLQLNTSRGVTTEAVGHFDDAASHAINIVGGEFPINGTRHTTLFVSIAYVRTGKKGQYYTET